MDSTPVGERRLSTALDNKNALVRKQRMKTTRTTPPRSQHATFFSPKRRAGAEAWVKIVARRYSHRHCHTSKGYVPTLHVAWFICIKNQFVSQSCFISIYLNILSVENLFKTRRGRRNHNPTNDIYSARSLVFTLRYSTTVIGHSQKKMSYWSPAVKVITNSTCLPCFFITIKPTFYT